MVKYNNMLEFIDDMSHNYSISNLDKKIKGIRDYELENLKVFYDERYELDDPQEELTLYLNGFGNVNKDTTLPIEKDSFNLRYFSKNTEDCKEIKLKVDNSEYLIGFYLTKQNRIILGLYNIIRLDLFNFLRILDLIKKLDLTKFDLGDLKKERFIKKLKEVKNKSIENLKSQIKGSEEDLKNSLSYIDMYNKSIRENSLILNTLLKESENYFEKIVKQMEEIKKFKLVTDVKYCEDGFIFCFENIIIKHNKKDYLMGDYECKVKLNGQLEFRNTNPCYFKCGNTLYIYHHPHISNTNISTICMGSAKIKLLNDYLQDFNLMGMAQILNLFLKSYTFNDSYNCLHSYDERNIIEIDGKRHMIYLYQKDKSYDINYILKDREEDFKPLSEYSNYVEEDNNDEEGDYEDE